LDTVRAFASDVTRAGYQVFCENKLNDVEGGIQNKQTKKSKQKNQNRMKKYQFFFNLFLI